MLKLTAAFRAGLPCFAPLVLLVVWVVQNLLRNRLAPPFSVLGCWSRCPKLLQNKEMKFHWYEVFHVQVDIKFQCNIIISRHDIACLCWKCRYTPTDQHHKMLQHTIICQSLSVSSHDMPMCKLLPCTTEVPLCTCVRANLQWNETVHKVHLSTTVQSIFWGTGIRRLMRGMATLPPR